MSIDGTTHALEPPFLVLATQNPIEYEAPTAARGAARPVRAAHGLRLPVVGRRVGDARATPRARCGRGRTASGRRPRDATRDAAGGRGGACRRERRPVRRRPRRGDRESPSVAVGSSPRGSLALLKLARCRAALAGRDFVTPDDVKGAAMPALAHRLVLRPRLWVQRRTGEDVVRDVLDEVGRRAPSACDTLGGRAARRLRGVAAAAFVAALALRRPELAVLAAPFALLVALGVGCPRRPSGPGSASTVPGRSRRRARGARCRAGRHRGRPARDRARAPTGPRARRRGQPGRPPPRRGRGAWLPLRVRCVRWMSTEVGEVWLRARDRVGLVRFEAVSTGAARSALPAPERLRRLITPARTQAATGSEVSPVRAEGLEFADTRPFVPGDRVRSVNWRATAPPRQHRRERAPPRAERGRRDLPRQLRGGACDRSGDARAGRPGRGDARVTLPRAA